MVKIPDQMRMEGRRPRLSEVKAWASEPLENRRENISITPSVFAFKASLSRCLTRRFCEDCEVSYGEE